MASSYYDSSGKNVVDGDVAYAADLNDINIAADTGFQLVEAAVDAIAANQPFYSDLAEKWAENPEDTAVEPGKYSALHWAAKAEDQAILADADRVQTGLDRIATAADRVQTGLDKTATAADRVQTGLDAVATAADRVQTGLDVIAAAGSASAAAASAVTAASFVPTPVSGDEGKIMTVADPFSDGYILEDINVPSGRKNYLINGNFDIWQRGVSQTAYGYGSADRWLNKSTTSTKTVDRIAFTLGQTEVPGNPRYFMRTTVTSASTASCSVIAEQRIESVLSLAGKTATVSFWAKANAPKSLGVCTFQSFGTGGSTGIAGIGQKVSLTTAWQYFKLSFSIDSILGKTIGSGLNDFLAFYFWFDAGSDNNILTDSIGNQSGVFDIAQIQVEEGDTATEFERRTVADELNSCMRYYQAPPEMAFSSDVTVTGAYYLYLVLPVVMRSTPVATVTNTGALGFPATVGAYSTTTKGTYESRVANATAAAGYFQTNWKLDAEL